MAGRHGNARGGGPPSTRNNGLRRARTHPSLPDGPRGPGMTIPTVAVAGYARTPFGKFGGTLRSLSLPELGTMSVVAALEDADIGPERVDEMVVGVNFPGGDRSIARQVQLRAGVPDDRVSYTVDRACCSSLAAISAASRSIRLGDVQVAVAGGVEN